MIFGITYMSYVTATGIIALAAWFILFIGFLVGLKSPVDIGLYFRAMFNSFKKSELRIGWSSSILGIEYIIGILFSLVIKSAWYPAKWIRQFIYFLLFGQKRKERLERDSLKDTKKKKKEHDGVY